MEIEDKLNWFKLKVLSPTITSLKNKENEEEDELVKGARLNSANVNEYTIKTAYFNFSSDYPKHLIPETFFPKDAEKKTDLTALVFESGHVYYAIGTPKDVYTKIQEYLMSLKQRDTRNVTLDFITWAHEGGFTIHKDNTITDDKGEIHAIEALYDVYYDEMAEE